MRLALTQTGVRHRHGSRFEPLRTIALTVAVATFLLSVVAVVGVIGTYRGWDARNEARSIRPLEFLPDETPAFLRQGTYDRDADNRPFDVVYLEALTEEPEPPPGLERWPSDGEVISSPELIGTEPVPSLGDQGRYGTTVGTIGVDGLTEAHERIIYVGVKGRLTERNAQVATGWGRSSPDEWFIGDLLGTTATRQPMDLLLVVVGLLLVAPAAWLVVTSIRIGATQRARRVEILGHLGASPALIRSALWGESRLGLMFGWGAAIVAAIFVSFVDLPLPGVAFTMRASDVRGQMALILVAGVVGVVATAYLSVSTVGLTRERRRSGSQVQPVTMTRAAASVVIACVTAIAMNLAITNALLEVVPLILGIGVLATLVTLPLSTKAWLVLFSRRWRSRAWSTGDPSGLTGAAQLAAAPGPATRFGATAAILVILVAYVFSFAQAMGSMSHQSRALVAAVGEETAVVTAFRQLNDQAWMSALEQLRVAHAVVEQRTEATGSLLLVGPEADLSAVGVEGDGSRPGWMRADFVLRDAPSIVGQIGPPQESVAPELLVTRRDGKPIDLLALKDELAAFTVPAWNAEFPGTGWVGAAAASALQARWVTWFGTLGVALSLTSLWISYANELLRVVRGLLAVQVIAPDNRFIGRVLMWRIVAPVTVAVLGGSGLALLLISPLTNADYQLPIGFTAICALATVGTGVVAWFITWRYCLRAARRMSMGIAEE